jgi:protein-S-isoprenylcysteine O-methyltransferase Ste14
MTIGVQGRDLASGAARPSGLTLARGLDIFERGLVVLAFGFFLLANVRSLNGWNIIISLGDLMTAVFVLLRRPTNNISLSPSDWTLAIVATVGVMLARPGGHALIGVAAPMTFWIAGVGLSIAAKLSLNVRFGIAPANRGVQAKGVYALVRHPMYAGYLLMQTAYLLINPTYWNLAIYAIAWSCQFARVQREERWLGQDPAYRAYAKAVRFRFLPFVA